MPRGPLLHSRIQQSYAVLGWLPQPSKGVACFFGLPALPRFVQQVIVRSVPLSAQNIPVQLHHTVLRPSYAGGIFCGTVGTPDLSLPCPGGYYCQANSPGALPCPPGSYCPAGSAEPTPCPGGSFCPLMSSAPEKCPRGFFCPAEARVAHACPAGTRMNPYDILQNSASTACEACPEV